MKKDKLNQDKIIGVIAGTSVDTQFGLTFLEEKNIKCIGAPISLTPQEQTELQVLNKDNLTKLVFAKVYDLKEQGATNIMIYCNSLSGAIDLEGLQLRSPLPIITPLDAYKALSCKFQTFGLISANCQSSANIERVILTNNPTAKVIGVSNLQIVEDIESRLSPEDIIKNHSLPQVIQAIVGSGVQTLILGCTHFDYIANSLSEQISDTSIFLPSNYMLNQLLKPSS